MSKRRNLITIIKQIQSGNIFLGEKIDSVNIEVVRSKHKPRIIPAPQEKSSWIDKILHTSPEPEIIEPEPEVIVWSEKTTTFNLEQIEVTINRLLNIKCVIFSR